MHTLFSNQEQENLKREHTVAMKRDLEEGLERWGKQVLEVQENNIRQAENIVEYKKKLRRQRSREER